LLVDPSPDNVARVKQGLSILEDRAAAEVADSDVRQYTVVRIADEIVIDLMALACGIDYEQHGRTRVSTFCLIHGSTQSPAGWDRLIPELRRHGSDAFAVNLPVDEPEAGATRYAEAIAETIRSIARDDVVAVAHSASGIFLPLLPERCRLRRLVFLAAFIPQLGTSPLQQLSADPSMMNAAWIGKSPADDDVAREFLFHDCAPDVVEWALTTRRLLVARGALRDLYPLTFWPDVPCASIVCAGDRTISPVWSRRAADEQLGVTAIELPGGHCPHVSRPAALAGVLVSLE
jgi:pimeloyl-ACP methyl ester carboxylesterase